MVEVVKMQALTGVNLQIEKEVLLEKLGGSYKMSR